MLTTETRYCVYVVGDLVPIFSSSSRARAEAKAKELRERKHKPLQVKVRRLEYRLEPGPKFPG